MFLDLDAWEPRTRVGRLVKEGRISSIDEIFQQGLPLVEPEIIDMLFGDTLEDDVVDKKFLKTINF